MVRQLKRYNCKNIIIIDNFSTHSKTRKFLKSVEEDVKVIFYPFNAGHEVFLRRDIYDGLPDNFIITDPDIEFNKDLPHDFISKLLEIQEKYQASKVGFALDISDYKFMFQDIYYDGKNIHDWESQFWKEELEKNLYKGYIDTTFHLFSKKYLYRNIYIRIAGNFTSRHLPWYIEEGYKFKEEDFLAMYKGSKGSTISSLALKYYYKDVLEVKKRNSSFKVRTDQVTKDFWEIHFPNWEQETFDIFDKYVKGDKSMLDIGSWIGPTVLYNSRRCRKVYAVEADPLSIDMLRGNLKLNNISNVKLIGKAIYHEKTQVRFGKNEFRENSKLNDSTSQIKSKFSEEDRLIQTITLKDIIDKYQIEDLCLIKVDIEGGEQFIIQDLLEFSLLKGVPCYISFHLSWWKSQEELLTFLEIFKRFQNTEQLIDKIRSDPFSSFLFLPKI